MEVITARAKEIQYNDGIRAISEYCSQYDSTLDMDVHHQQLGSFHVSTLGIVLQCRLLPASSCRMRIMKLFRDMRARFDDGAVSDLTVVIRTKIARQEVMQLLQHDLVPAIRFDVTVGVMITSNVGFRYCREYARLSQVDE